MACNAIKPPLQVLNELLDKHALKPEWKHERRDGTLFRSSVCISNVYFWSDNFFIGKKNSMQETAKAALADINMLHVITETYMRPRKVL